MKNEKLGWLRGFSFFALLFVFPILAVHAQQLKQQPLGLFEDHGDIGSVKIPGSATYNADNQEYFINGSGTNMWADRDEFHFVWKRMSGDFILRTRVQFFGAGTDPHRKMGWIIRSSLDSSATYVDVAVHGDGLTSMQFRRTWAGETEQIESAVTGAEVVQLERKGNTYTMSVAKFGDTLTTDQVTDIALGDEVYVGLFVCSHNEDVVEPAVFRNVRIIVPAADDFVPYRDYIGSNVEVMDVATGYRKILHQSPISLQAPNWTRDDKSLIYNSEGLLYRFDLERGFPAALNTAFASRNNNDHVLSFDGSMLAISNHTADANGQSIVYTVPVTGGTPKRITADGPSYLHGWSPDARFLVYTGGRNGNYDIYKIPSEGGDEIRLTTVDALDDGPEYTPDGKYIYFNSTRSGLMQIWRMKPDGSDQEQITDDEYNNWFPHISPDGKQMVIISYPQEVAPDDHPFYKRVMLRLLPVDGGEPKVIAYIYGGQGTINVPSWSPDGTKIAFVSNTKMQ